MNPFLQQAPIKGVKKIIAVGSGKGGVGKSTTSVNLAAALKQLGYQVGLLDADIYGPSIPRMLGAAKDRPEVDNEQKILPVIKHGIRMMSMGFLVEENLSIVWRGPMLFKAMDQFLRDVRWGELDYLIVDLPPGTGDVPLTLAQKVPVSGGLVVCTPQNIALADAKKAFDMFEKINVPVLGVAENMAYYSHPETGEELEMFPSGELNVFLDVKRIPKLGRFGFEKDVALSSESGIPEVFSKPDDKFAKGFMDMARKLVEMPQLKI